LTHLRAMRVLVDAEDVLAVLDQAVALLGDDRREQHFVRMEAHAALLCTSSSAASLTSTVRAQTIWDTSSADGAVTIVLAMLRNDLISVSSSGRAITSS